MASADFTIADVLAWARTKPADEAYDFLDSCNCALAQFLRETARAVQPRVIPSDWRDGLEGARREYPYLLNIAVGSVWGGTFGKVVRNIEVIRRHYDELALLVPGNVCTPAFATHFSRLLSEPTVSDTWVKADAYLSDIEDVARERVSA